jgi:hypothetical protein
MGPLQANSFTGGIGDIQNALLQVNSQQGLPGMSQQPMLGSTEEEEDEVTVLGRMKDMMQARGNAGGGGYVGQTLSGQSMAGQLAKMFMGGF